MRTLKLTIAYDGTRYAGWQRQAVTRSAFGVRRSEAKVPTVQGTLERVLSRVLDERVHVVGSGRTDSGVHALAQVAHVRSANHMPLATLRRALNQLLPPDIVVTGIARAGATFHARFSAKRKRYRYRLALTPAPSPFARHYAYHVRGLLRIAAMRRAARALKGAHDFKPFQVAGRHTTNTTRCVTDLRWVRRDGELWFEIEANGFLYKMIRRIMGTLLDVGRGSKPPTVIKNILRHGNPCLVGPTAPAHGLTLVSVTYILPALRSR